MLPLCAPTDAPLRVLCLGAHPDDIEIGCGGTLLAIAAARPVELTGVVMTGTPDRHRETAGILPEFVGGAPTQLHLHKLDDGRLPAEWGHVKQLLEDVADQCAPDVIFAPRLEDAHQDHRTVARLVPTVWRDALVLHYEIPKWDGDLRPVMTYSPLSEQIANRKVDLLDRGFPSQHQHDWWDQETFLALMRLRGVECRTRYAEGFSLTKAVLAWAS